MSKGSGGGRKSSGKTPTWLIVVTLAVSALLVVFMLFNRFWKEPATPPVEGTDSQPQGTDTQSTNGLVQQAKADYEKWLAAAMVVGVSMEYPEFELDGIYAASATSVADKKNSDGVYILFTSGGESMALYGVALDAERTAAGTKDISTEALGFATFDLVDPASVDTDSMTEIKIEELEELINQSLLVSIYTH